MFFDYPDILACYLAGLLELLESSGQEGEIVQKVLDIGGKTAYKDHAFLESVNQ